MATFTKGQRVKVRDNGTPWAGREGVFVQYGGLRPIEILHGMDSAAIFNGEECAGRACDLVPLTDPAADQFIERIKKLEREPLSIAPKVTQ